jgi:hypothetical protein
MAQLYASSYIGLLPSFLSLKERTETYPIVLILEVIFEVAFRANCLTVLYYLSGYAYHLSPSELQFGFKVESSPDLCFTVLNESLVHFVNNHSSISRTFLDSTKAFDKCDIVSSSSC